MKRAADIDAAAVEAVLDRHFAAYNAPGRPGLAVAVFRGGARLAARCYGAANVEHAIAWHPRTPAHIASVTKHMAAALAVVLARKGVVDLDAAIQRYLPGLRTPAPISLRHLLTNTSGLFIDEALAFLAGRGSDCPADLDYLYRLVASAPRVLHAPGAAYVYNDTGFRLAIRILERAAGADADTLARTHLFGPLGMGDTRFVLNDEAVIPGLAQCYHREPGGGLKRYFGYMHSSGDGGVVSTLDDMSAWTAMLAAPSGEWAEVVETLRTPVIGLYGHGLDLGTHRAIPWCGHTGTTFGYCGLHVFGGGSLSIAFLGNDSAIDIRALPFLLFDDILGAGEGDGPSTPYLERRRHLQQGVDGGRYVNAKTGLVVSVERTGGVMRLGFLGGGAYLRQDADGAWSAREGLMSCRLRDAGAGSIDLDLGEGWTTFARAHGPQPWSSMRHTCVGRFAALETGSTIDVVDADDAPAAWIAGGPSRAHRIKLDAVGRNVFAGPALSIKYDRLHGGRYRQITVNTFGARHLTYKRVG